MDTKAADRPGAPDASKKRARINLERTVILVVDNALGVDILSHIFYGFGVRKIHRCETAEEAMAIVADHTLDLIVTEALLKGQDGYDFIRTIRQNSAFENNRFTPAILLSAHTAAGKVIKARDCGANFFVAKPISPRVILDRLLWVAREQRQFLQTDTYAGPDRRFHDEPLAADVVGRRREDQAAPAQIEERHA